MSRICNHSLSTPPVLFTLLIVTLASNVVQAKDKMPWVQNLAQAQQLAASSNRLLMVHFTADGCPPCKRLTKKIYSQASFANQLAADFVPVKINATTSPQIAAQFNVQSWPMDVILTPQGQEIMHDQPSGSSQYATTLRQAAWRYKSNPNHSAVQVAQFPMQPPKSTAPMEPPALGMNSGQFAGDQNPRPLPPETSRFANLKGPHALGSPFANNDATSAPADEATYASAVATQQRLQSNQANQSASPMQGGQQTVAPAAFATAAASQAPPSNRIAADTANDRSQVQLASGTSSNSVESQVIVNEFATGRPAVPAERQGFRSPAASHGSNADRRTSEYNNGETSPTQSGSYWNEPQQVSPPAAANQLAAPSHSDFDQSTTSQQRTSFESAATASKPSVAMEGYCAVTLADNNEWVQGDRRWGAKHRGRVFLFHSLAAQQKFLADPERYSPILVGYDPVALAKSGSYVEGKREHGIRYKDQIVMFHSEQALEDFSASPSNFMQTVYQVMQSQPQTMMR